MEVNIVRRGGIVETMTVEEFSRWMCLVEAFHFIFEKGKELNIDPEKLIKPNAIITYIQERMPAMLSDVKTEVAMGIL